MRQEINLDGDGSESNDVMEHFTHSKYGKKLVVVFYVHTAKGAKWLKEKFPEMNLHCVALSENLFTAFFYTKVFDSMKSAQKTIWDVYHFDRGDNILAELYCDGECIDEST